MSPDGSDTMLYPIVYVSPVNVVYLAGLQLTLISSLKSRIRFNLLGSTEAGLTRSLKPRFNALVKMMGRWVARHK